MFCLQLHISFVYLFIKQQRILFICLSVCSYFFKRICLFAELLCNPVKHDGIDLCKQINIIYYLNLLWQIPVSPQQLKHGFEREFFPADSVLGSPLSLARENKYIPPGQRNLSWGSGRQNSPRLAQCSPGPHTPRSAPHDYNSPPNTDQRVVNGGKQTAVLNNIQLSVILAA